MRWFQSYFSFCTQRDTLPQGGVVQQDDTAEDDRETGFKNEGGFEEVIPRGGVRLARCAGVSAARVNPPSGPMQPQCDWLGPLACALDTRLCYNRPFPVAGLGQCSFLLLSRSAQLPAQIRLLKENRGLPLALPFLCSAILSVCGSVSVPLPLLLLSVSYLPPPSLSPARSRSSPLTLVFLSWKLTQNGCQGITSQGAVPLNNPKAGSKNIQKTKTCVCDIGKTNRKVYRLDIPQLSTSKLQNRQIYYVPSQWESDKGFCIILVKY